MNKVTEHWLQFSFGPVQGFVAQARRTRDFWAGSYLLSYLSGQAMAAVIHAGGEIWFPNVDEDPLMRLILHGPSGSAELGDRVGSLPNRFLARVPPEITGSICVQEVKAAWAGIEQAVYRHIDQHLSLAPDHAARWKRQVESLWDFTWVMRPEPQALDLRKNQRTHLPPPEPGEKCTLCGERQELSGLGLGGGRGGRGGQERTYRSEMREWWSQLRERLNATYDLEANERLCAVCLTKRFFPRIAQQALGWPLPTNAPSVVYMAAVDWLEWLLQNHPKEAATYAKQADQLGVQHSERATNLLQVDVSDGGLTQMDGNAFFTEGIQNRDFPMPDEQARQSLIQALGRLQSVIGRKASPFYALLMMDGDGLGKLLSSADRTQQEAISAALGRFSHQVPIWVREHNGFLVYAGGDDVLALLPVDTAIACAIRCREGYRTELAVVPDLPSAPTISGAIVFSHMKEPLRGVIQGAHALLDQVAKDGAGRDALAVRVWKPGGAILTWVQKWDHLLLPRDQAGEQSSAKDREPHRIAALIKRFTGGEMASKEFSSRFFYKLGPLFELAGYGMGKLDLTRLLVAEYLASRDLVWPPKEDGSEWTDMEKRAEAAVRIEELRKLCLQPCVQTGGVESEELRPDGALLIRFLVQKEV